MSKSISLWSFCFTGPATLGVGAGLQFANPLLRNTILQVFRVGCDLSPVVVQHSLTFAGFVPHAHLVHRPHCETDFLGPDPTPVWVRCHADRPCALLNEHIQLKVSKELWCCITSVETLLFKAFCHEVYPACSNASSAIQLFSQSPQHRGRVPNAACCSIQTAAGSTWHCSSSSTWKYALVTSAVNV